MNTVAAIDMNFSVNDLDKRFQYTTAANLAGKNMIVMLRTIVFWLNFSLHLRNHNLAGACLRNVELAGLTFLLEH